MGKIYKSNLVVDALNKLSTQDYVASAIISYMKQDDEVFNLVNNITDSNNHDIFIKIDNLKDSLTHLSKIFSEILKDDYSKLSNKNDLDELTMMYILNNFMKLCSDSNLVSYYKRILFLRQNLQDNFTFKMQVAIMLRAALIVDKLFEEQDTNALNRFMKLLERSMYFDDQILYIIYYGLFSDETSNQTKLDKEDNKKVTWELLNNNDILPDSIIIELCKDEQFNGFDPYVTLFIMNVFFMLKDNEKLSKDHTINKIQKIFSNDVKNFGTKAEFLDLSNLIEIVDKRFFLDENENVYKEEIKKEITNIISGKKILNRREDNKGYGTI